MQTPCNTCGAESTLAENGKYVGNCETCCQMYQLRDARQKREKAKLYAMSCIGSGFIVFGVARVLLLFSQSIIAESTGFDPQDVIRSISGYLLVVPMVTLTYGIYRLATLRDVSGYVAETRLAAPTARNT